MKVYFVLKVLQNTSGGFFQRIGVGSLIMIQGETVWGGEW
jgi:hypothetical protein